MDEIRDIVVIVALIALSLVALAFILLTALGGYLLLRIVRALRRLHDQRIVPAVDQLNARLDEHSGEGASAPMRALLAAGMRRLVAGRRRKRRRVLAFLRHVGR